MDDLISRQVVINALDAVCDRVCQYAKKQRSVMCGACPLGSAFDVIEELSPAQPEITDEQAILHLQSTGWMQNHDHEMYMMGVRERLADDSDSYDSLIPAERKVGKWQITECYPHNVYCSVCHTKFAQTHWTVWKEGSLPRNYCPNCGARMMEGQ